jgi:hypothetical protein
VFVVTSVPRGVADLGWLLGHGIVIVLMGMPRPMLHNFTVPSGRSIRVICHVTLISCQFALWSASFATIQ